MPQTVASPTKPKILYVYDPLCGWCYGFSPVITKLFNEYKEAFDFDIISGGMVLNERAGNVTPEMADYILKAIPNVESYTGIRFGETHKEQLRQHRLFQSSLKPSAALCAFKKQLPELAIPFAAAMQQQFFYEGKSLEDDAVYTHLAQSFNLQADEFLADTNSDRFKYMAHLEFDHVQNMGITGFPALIGNKGEAYFWLAEGYQPYENVLQAIRQFREVEV